MKKKLIKPAFLIYALMALTVFPSIGATEQYYYWDSDNYGRKISDKLLGGLTNTGLAVIEIPKCVINTTNEYNFMFGLTAGLLKGVVNFIGRTMVGLVETVTFLIPTKAVPQPTVPWSEFDTDTSYDKVFKLRD